MVIVSAVPVASGIRRGEVRSVLGIQSVLKKSVRLKGTDLEVAEKLVSEIGRDFSPGMTDAESMWALAPGTTLLATLRARAAFFRSLFSCCCRSASGMSNSQPATYN